MAFEILKLALMLMYAKNAASSCYSSTKYANTNTQYLSNSYYSNNEDCQFTILPSSSYTSGYYLEIIWTVFDVKGEMPDCENDYVEVFLTSSYKSIGKYCSNNLKTSLLFKMYAHDGYAKIKFHSDGSTTGRGFTLSYRLKNKNSQYIGAYSSTYCSSYYSYLSSGNVYSQGWPRQYAKSSSTCTLKLASAYHVSTKIAIMDADLKTTYYCGYQDYLRLKGSYYNNHGFYDLTTIMCTGSSAIKGVTSKVTHFNFQFVRKKGSSSRRGFMAGYVQYDEKKFTFEIKARSKLPGLIGMAVGGLFLFIKILIIAICLCKRNARRRAAMQNGTTANANLAAGIPLQQMPPGTIPPTANAPPYQQDGSPYPVAQGTPPYQQEGSPYPVAQGTPSYQQEGSPYPVAQGTPPYPTATYPTLETSQPPASAPLSDGNPGPNPGYTPYPPTDGQGQPMYPSQPPPLYSQTYPTSKF